MGIYQVEPYQLTVAPEEEKVVEVLTREVQVLLTKAITVVKLPLQHGEEEEAEELPKNPRAKLVGMGYLHQSPVLQLHEGVEVEEVKIHGKVEDQLVLEVPAEEVLAVEELVAHQKLPPVMVQLTPEAEAVVVVD